ncbi:MAG: DUF4340 domain-containing protein [Anaerolineales bacterium]|nr:DUF4340 domain-containing protein [Anaerolineales bacterium]
MNRKLTIGLVVVFGALLVYVLLVQRPKDLAADVTPTARVTEYLFAVSAEQVSGIRVEDRVNGMSAALMRDAASGVWTLAEPGPQPADQALAANAATALTGLTIANTVTSTTDLTLFGVLSPTYQLALTLTDGSQLAAAIGDKTPTGTAYYVLRPGDTNVRTVGASLLDPVLGLAVNPPVVPPTATAAVTDTVVLTGTVTPGATAAP